jgi:hypothetical protein
MNIFLSFDTALHLKELGIRQGESLYIYLVDSDDDLLFDEQPTLRTNNSKGAFSVDAFTTQELSMAFDPKEPDFLELELLDQLSETNKKLMYDTRAFWDVEFVAALVIANIKNATLKISEINNRLKECKLIESL